MTAAEKDLAIRLSRCRYLPGSAEKAFVRDMAYLASRVDPEITEGQAEYLKRTAHRFRVQLAEQKPDLFG